jgi:hypothetical protein
VAQKLALTEAQKHAIYNAVLQQRVHTSTSGLPLAVGAPVPPSITLSDLPVEALPNQATFDDPGATVLKYAIVEGEVVMVDSIQMRVVAVIRGGAISGAIP